MTTKPAEETAEPNADEIDTEVSDEHEDREDALAFERFLARSPVFQVSAIVERITNPLRYEPVIGLAASVGAMTAEHDIFHLASAAGATKYDLGGLALATNLAATSVGATRCDEVLGRISTGLAAAAKVSTYNEVLGGMSIGLAAAAKVNTYNEVLGGMSTGLAAVVSRLNGDDMLGSVGGLCRTNRAAELLAEAAAPHRLLSARIEAFDTTKMLSLHNAVLGLASSDRVPPWNVMVQMARDVAGIGVFADVIQRMGVADRSLGKALPEPLRDLWSTHWKLTGMPTLSFLGREWDKPVGLLLEMATPDSGASLSWLSERRAKPQISRAVLSPEAAEDSSTPIIVDCDPCCWICGNPLISLKETIRWLGPKVGIRTRYIFPVCATCTRTEQEDPGFILRSLPGSDVPALRVKPEVIRGSGKGDGKPRGRLRLLRRED